MLTALVAIGIKESLRVNLVLVGVKLFIVLFVIFAGLVLHQPRQLDARSSRRRSRREAAGGPDASR